MNKEIQEILEDLKNKEITVDDLTHNDKIKLFDYITNLQEEIRRLKEKIKTDIDLLKNYEFDKYNWNYMEQQAVVEYLEKEILEEGK